MLTPFLHSARVSDPVNPTPEPSRVGGTIIPFLYNPVGASGERSVEGSGSVGYVVFLFLLVLFAFLGFLLSLSLFFLLGRSLPQFSLCLLLLLPSFLLGFSRLLWSLNCPLLFFFLLLLLLLSSLFSSLPSFAPPGFPLAPPFVLYLLPVGLCPLFLLVASSVASSSYSVSSPLLGCSFILFILSLWSLVICRLLSSSFCSALCLSCCLFWLFGFCRLMVSTFGHLFYCSLSDFGVSSGPFSGSSCVFSFCFFFFFICSSCHFFPVFSPCSFFVVCSLCYTWGSSVLC